MSKPHIHAKSSAKRHGGKPDDYVDLHEWMDATKAWIPDNRHRAIRHHAEGIFEAMQIFGATRVNSEGKTYSVRDVLETHCIEDFGGFIPTAADYLAEMESQPWMNGVRGHYPPSARKLQAAKRLQKADRNLIGEAVDKLSGLAVEVTAAKEMAD